MNLAFRLLLFNILVLKMCSRFYVFFRKLILAWIVFGFSFYSKDCFDRDVILFNSGILSQLMSYTNYLSVNISGPSRFFMYVNGRIYIACVFVCVCVCLCAFAYMHVHQYMHTLVHIYIFRVVFSLSISLSLSLHTFT